MRKLQPTCRGGSGIDSQDRHFFMMPERHAHRLFQISRQMYELPSLRLETRSRQDCRRGPCGGSVV